MVINFRVVSSTAGAGGGERRTGWWCTLSLVFSVRPALSTLRLHPKTSHQIIHLPIKYRAMHKTKEITETKGVLAENVLIL